MRVPIDWLREYVDVGLKSENLAECLTMAGSEVSTIEFHGKGIEGVVVGKIKSIQPHHKADNLLVLQVDIGTKIIQIVTNVRTLRVGDKVPVAMHGAKLAKEIHVQKRELHGVESFGMLCSLEHLGLAERGEEVMILDKDTPVGQNIKNVLGVKGTILEVDVLPNRGDLLSIIGVAREVSAVLNKKLESPKFTLKESVESINKKVKIEIKDFELCPRYMARVIEGVSIGESPPWMRERLIACGLRPINNVVDITNYVLLEMGQPLHAFDLSTIKGRKIIVRKAREGEGIITLDGEKRKLRSDTLVIADEKKAIAVAGVMGGKEGEVSDDTTSILLESAYFNPASINKTSKLLKLRTDSSIRFERGVDWEGVESALDRAAYLIAKYALGKVARGVMDVKKKDREPKVIPLRMDTVNNILGTNLSNNQITSVLKRLGFKACPPKSREAGRRRIEVPTFRAGDIEREIDLVEEIARIHGYDKIGSNMPNVTYVPSIADQTEKNIDAIRNIVKGFGFLETQTFSIVSPKELKRLALPESDPRAKALMISNPLSEEISVLRTMLVPSLLSVLSRNISRQLKDLAVFEVGKVFLKTGKTLPEEKLTLALAITGDVLMGSFKVGPVEEVSFGLVKAVVDCLLEEFGILDYSIVEEDHFLLQRGRAASIVVRGEEVGFLGDLSASLHAEYDLPGVVCVAEVDLEKVLKSVSLDKRYKPLAKYPKVSRDIAMFVPQKVHHDSILNVIKELGAPILENVTLFDRYTGVQVPKGFVSLAYRLDYRDPGKTLIDEEVNVKHEEVTKALTEQLGVQIRRQ